MKKQVAIAGGLILLAVVAIGAVMANPERNNLSNEKPQSNSSAASATEAPASEPNTVDINNYKFGPGKLTVKKGTKVTWVNRDKDRHSIIPDKESDSFAGSSLLAKDEKYSITFDKAGIYEYHCGPHPYMKASIEVTE